MTILQIVNAVSIYGWLIAVLIFMILIWRNSIQILSAQQVLNAVAIKNAEASEKSAQAAQKSAEAVALLLKEKPPA